MCAPTIKRKRAGDGGGRKRSRKEEKVSHRIFLFVCFAILYFIVAVVVVVHNEQNRAHDMHDTYYPIEWVLEDKLLFPMLLRKTHTVCGWALVSLCVLACDVSVSIQISVRIEAGFVFPVCLRQFWKSVVSLLCLYCTNFTYSLTGLCFKAWALRMSTFVIIHHSLSPYTYLSITLFSSLFFLSFFVLLGGVCVLYGVFCDKISPPISYQLI